MGHENYPFGYCTNVHAGTDLEQAKSNLLQFAAKVRERVAKDSSLPVGLWLAEDAANSLLNQQQIEQFHQWLDEHRFTAYTFNGFPQGDFHQEVVKHRVYEPTWACNSRANYTKCLAEILEQLLPAEGVGSISTLPLGWPHAPWHAENFKNCADNLLDVAKFLDRIAQNSGKEIVLAIEPEPGCVLNTAPEIVDFFEHYLFSGPDADIARRYLTVCHDICHSGVMFESQATALDLYRTCGIRIGKTQVSSAVHVPWDHCKNQRDQENVLNQLSTFDEPKYLHQATRSSAQGELQQLADDLPRALKDWINPESMPSNPWRVHFHVPIFVDTFDYLQTTQSDISQATSYLEEHAHERINSAPWFTGHYEVETYAWPVLPPSLATTSLSDGIAQELEYFHRVLTEARSSH